MSSSIFVLGSPGSYGDQTRQRILPRSKALFVRSNSHAVESVIEDNGIGIVPVSNPYGGSVKESWDALEKHRDRLIIGGSHTLPIDHAVVQRCEHIGSEVRRIFSHPQAYNQSKPTLDTSYPGHVFIESKSTIGALDMIENPHDAALCSAGAIRGNQVLNEKYYLLQEKISPSDNATKFVVIATRTSVQEIADLPPSNIDILRIQLEDKPWQLAIKSGLVNLLGNNIYEWDNIKTIPGVSPLYTFLMITSRLRRSYLSRLLMKRYSIQPITQKEELC